MSSFVSLRVEQAPRSAIALVIALVIGAGCSARLDDLFCDDPGCVFTADEWRRLRALSPMPDVPEDRSNGFRDAFDATLLGQAASLGRSFYFDPEFSGPATQVDALGRSAPPARAPLGAATGVSCATCHDLKRAGADVTSVPGNVSAGAGWTDVNAPATVNSVYQDQWFWNGRADSSWALAVAVAESRTTMNGNRLKTAWVIADKYRDRYDAAFGAAGFPLSLVGKSTDVATLVDPASGQCTTAEGICPPGCREVSTTVRTPPPVFSIVTCWPRFPLQGKPGAIPGCQAGLPMGVTEPFHDAFDCMDPADQTAVTRVLVNWAKALDAYQAHLANGDSPFDRFVAEGTSSSSISPQAKRGARLFVGKAACVDCHSGSLLSDHQFHNIGVPQAGPLVPTVDDCPAGSTACDCVTGVPGGKCLPWGAWDGLDRLAGVDAMGVLKNRFTRASIWSDDSFPMDTSRDARLQLPLTDDLKGAWRTPSLRNVALTAPYMHDGLFAALAEVVAHYNAGGAAGAVGIKATQIKPLMLSPEEQADLVAFLETLTGGPLPSELVTPGGQ